LASLCVKATLTLVRDFDVTPPSMVSSFSNTPSLSESEVPAPHTPAPEPAVCTESNLLAVKGMTASYCYPRCGWAMGSSGFDVHDGPAQRLRASQVTALSRRSVYCFSQDRAERGSSD